MDQKRFGPFILERMIGRGGMGAVYRAHHEETGQTVAVKALLLPLEQERERFEAEIATLKLLRCENIVKLYGFGQEDGILYYAMEYIDGPSLSVLLKRGRRFTWEEVVYIGASVCKALKHAHDRGVVHRDVKPANILLLDDGRVKVSDYGIAQYFGSSRLTSANQVVGTIEYMAPEQAQAGALTPRADVYSLGALMYALLTGRPPYVARSLPELLNKFREETPESIRKTRPETPKVVEDVVFELLKLHPEDRPGDARLIGRRLEGLLKTSLNCPSGNPFLDEKFRSESENASGSRVDLEESTDTSELDERREELETQVPDFPYRPFDYEPDERLSFESPFEKTTERATSEEETSDAHPAPPFPQEKDETNDFVLLGEETPTNEPVSRETIAYDHNKEVSIDSKTSANKEKAADELGETIACSPIDTKALTLLERESNRSTEFELDDNAVDRRQGTREEEPSLSYRNATTEVAIPQPKKPFAPPKSAPSQEGLDLPYDELDSADDIEAKPLEQFRRSRFTPVDETELGDLPTHDDERPFFMRFRFWGLATAALCMVGFLFYATRPPTADDLYEKIDHKLSASYGERFAAELRRSRSDLQRFVDLFPNDDRAHKAEYFLNELKLDDFERKIQGLERKESSQPIVRIYLEAQDTSDASPEESMARLQAFIAFFGSESAQNAPYQEVADEAAQESAKGLAALTKGNPWKSWDGDEYSATTLPEQLVLLAKKRARELYAETVRTRRADLALLNDRLELAQSLDATNPKRANEMREAALALYGREAWAQNALKKIQFSKEQKEENGEETKETAEEEEILEL